MRRVPAANLLVEREHLASGFGQTVAAEQHVGVDVVATDKVANTTPPGVGGPLPPGSFPLRVAVAGVGLQRDRPELIETHHHPVNRAGTVQVEHARGFFFEARVGAAFPGARALEGDLPFEQDSPERLEREAAYHPSALQIALQSPQRPARERFPERLRGCQVEGLGIRQLLSACIGGASGIVMAPDVVPLIVKRPPSSRSSLRAWLEATSNAGVLEAL